MSLNPKRTIEELKELRALTSDDNGAQRVAWTDTWLRARSWFEAKAKSLPVEHHYDAAGNSYFTLPGESEKALLIGGHIDSVPNGGWLDGCLDLLAGLEIQRRFAEQYNGRPPVTIRVVDWADEEGARFGRSLQFNIGRGVLPLLFGFRETVNFHATAPQGVFHLDAVLVGSASIRGNGMGAGECG